MKKSISIIICFVIASVLIIGQYDYSYARTVKSYNKEVKGRVVGDATEPPVYSVDVKWGAMNFTCSTVVTPVWNEDSHTYDETYKSEWKAEGNTIQITNHSNIDVKAKFKYVELSKYNMVKGKFDKNILILPSAEGKAKNSKELIGTRELTLSGTLLEQLDNYTAVGNVKIEID